MSFNLDGLEKFGWRPAWSTIRDSVAQRHLSVAAKLLDVDYFAVPLILKGPWRAGIFTAISDDFFTCSAGNGGANVVDTYLRTSGKAEKPQAKQYMRLLRDSAPGIYEVKNLDSGGHMTLNDLVRGSDVNVLLETENSVLEDGNIFIGRLLPLNGEYSQHSGLEIHPETAEWLVDSIKRKVDIARRRGDENSSSVILKESAAFFTNVWLVTTHPNPLMRNVKIQDFLELLHTT